MADEEYIKKSSLKVQEHLYDALYNMSTVLEDAEGKIAKTNANFILKNLRVTSDGSVDLPMSGVEMSHSALLGEDLLTRRLTDNAHALYKQLGSRNSDKIKPVSYFKIEDVLCSLLQSTSNQSIYTRIYSCYAYLEIHSLYLALVSHTPGDIFGYTESDLDMISTNLRYMTNTISTVDSGRNAYEALNVLKHIQRTILFVRANMKIVLR